MGRYSSDSDTSYQGKKSRKKRSSSVSSSSSHYSSRKSKKSKRGRRSRSRDRDKRSKRSSRDRSRTKHRRSRSHSRHRHRRKHSRSLSASSSRSKHKSHKSRSPSPSKSSKKSPESSYSGRDATQKAMSPFSKKMSSSNDSSRRRSASPVRNTDDELLQRLNAHAVQAMVENAKTRVQNLVEEQANRQSAVIDINAPNFAPKPFTSSQKDKDEDPVVVQPSPLQTPNTNVIEIENERNILSPNVILEDETAKLNRWIKKLYLIRQRAINGEMIVSY